MLIQLFSKDAKRGVAFGSNNLTSEKIAAGAVTAASLLAVSAIGGLADAVTSVKAPKKSNRPGKGKAPSSLKKKKKGLILIAVPAVYGAVKSTIKNRAASALTAKFTPAPKESIATDLTKGIELIDAITISSEEEIYEHI